MNPMQNCSTTKSTSKLPRRPKSKKKKDSRVNDAQVAATPSEFSFAIAKIAVAQICQSVGYKRSKSDALETLTNVSTKYLQAIARSAASFAIASNRSDSNLFDFINGIHDLSSVQGFPGGSELHKSNLLRSAALKEMMNFVKLSNEVPFAKPIPTNNVSVSQNPATTIDSGTSMCCFKKAKKQCLHVPKWLPDFPKESLYKNCDQVLVKERKCGEKLWEHSLAVEYCSGKNSGVLQCSDINGKETKETRMELAKGRGRVKFKIGGEEEKQSGLGVNMMNGVCKGRKRVSWNHGKINDCMVEENEDERSAFKRKKIA
ncbi:transcription initiation factor TFIID subunit 8-like [Gastrolobium bilobum]|uniref:transcription initiation factor TFIID subunit 8-like n=1 Tax=Gastrolobium bilobum TaxID=150636 RepID=UPI002AB1CEA0|nr:transcription initiation factor TFIID subunit 8-like [Gastrolobium bilobum]